MIERLIRSWELLQASAKVLRADKELLVLPVISALASVAVAGCFLGLAMGTGWAEAFCTPFKMYKRYANYEGGTAVRIVDRHVEQIDVQQILTMNMRLLVNVKGGDVVGDALVQLRREMHDTLSCELHVVTCVWEAILAGRFLRGVDD